MTNYKLDVSKIQTLEDIKNVFECMNLVSNVSEDNEKYELTKKYFTIPYVPEPVKMNWEYFKKNDLNSKTDEKKQTQIYGNVNSKGTLRELPFLLNTEAEFFDKTLNIKSLELHSGDSRITASAQITPKNIASTWNIVSKDINELYPELQGELSTQGNITDLPLPLTTINPIKPRINAHIDAKKLRIAKQQIGAFKGEIDIDWRTNAEQNKNRIDMRANNIVNDAITVNSVAINATGTLATHQLAAEINTDKGKLDLQLNGQLNTAMPSPQWDFLLEKGSLTPIVISQKTLHPASLATWQLQQPTTGKIAKTEQALQQQCWQTKNASLCFDGVRNNKRLDGQVSLDQLPITYLEPLLPSGFIWKNTVIAGNANIQLPHNDEPSIDITLNTSAGELLWEENTLNSTDKKTVQHINISPGQFAVASDKKVISATLKLPIANQTGILGTLRIDNNHASFIERSLTGDLRLELDNIAPFASFIPDASDLKGELNSQWNITGLVKRPLLEGKLSLSDGQLRLNGPGIFLKEVSLELQGDKSGIRYNAAAASGGGLLTMVGHVTLKNKTPQFDVSINGQDVQVFNTPEAVVYASPALKINSQDENINIEGELTIPKAIITPKKLPESVVTSSDDQIIIQDQQTQNHPTVNKQKIQAAIRLTLGEDVQVDGFGFKGKTQGSLLVTKAPQGPTLGNGKIRIIDGEYRALGQGLVIEKGEIIFAEAPIDKPGVDIKAFRRPAEGITVGVYARGPIVQPELTIFSEPPMQQAEQLSWLVLGRAPENASEGENNALNQLLLSLAINRGDSVLTSLSNTFNLDTLGIKTGSGEAGAASDNDLAELVLGKYLSPNLYVSYGIGLFKPINVLSLEYSLGKHWKLTSETSSESSGGDLVYTIEK